MKEIVGTAKNSVEEWRKSSIVFQDAVGRAEQIDLPVNHHFANGVYVRETTLPAESIVVGKIHRYPTVNMLIQGEVTVSNEYGVNTYTAPHVWTSKAMEKRIVIAIVDSIWCTTHPTDSTDLEEIEREVIAESYDNLLENT